MSKDWLPAPAYEVNFERDPTGKLTAHVKPTVDLVAPLVRALYATPEGTSGCCLHNVLEDGNVLDSNVAFCLEWAKAAGHPKCVELAELLARMTKTQRLKLGGRART